MVSPTAALALDPPRVTASSVGTTPARPRSLPSPQREAEHGEAEGCEQDDVESDPERRGLIERMRFRNREDAGEADRQHQPERREREHQAEHTADPSAAESAKGGGCFQLAPEAETSFLYPARCSGTLANPARGGQRPRIRQRGVIAGSGPDERITSRCDPTMIDTARLSKKWTDLLKTHARRIVIAI